MKKFLAILILGLTVSVLTKAESKLPKCQGKAMSKWTNCYGTKESLEGHKYIGEFVDGKFHGQGIFLYKDRKYIGEIS